MAKRNRKSVSASVRNDGMLNVVTGLGSAKDVAARTQYKRDRLLRQDEVESIFSGDGLGRKIVEMPAEESLRRWLTVTGKDGESVVDAMEHLKTQDAITDAYVWSRLYGGAAVVRLVDDGGVLDQPLNLKSIRRVLGYRVVDRYSISWTSSDLSVDTNSPQFGEPEIYTITPSSGPSYRAHYSRLSIIDGLRLPKNERDRNDGWGASALQGAYSYLMRVGEGYSYSANIMRDFVQSVLSMNGLTDMLAAGEDDIVMKRINMLDLSRSILNSIILDADSETYTKTASSVAGLADLLDRNMEGLCGATKPSIPMMKLIGRAPSGLGANGETVQRDYYDSLEADRASCITPIMRDFIRDIYLSSDGPTNGIMPDQWSIAWNSMYEPTDTEKATMRKTVAETDTLYWQMGALDPQEVRDSRFKGGDWTMETTIDEGVDADDLGGDDGAEG